MCRAVERKEYIEVDNLNICLFYQTLSVQQFHPLEAQLNTFQIYREAPYNNKRIEIVLYICVKITINESGKTSVSHST